MSKKFTDSLERRVSSIHQKYELNNLDSVLAIFDAIALSFDDFQKVEMFKKIFKKFDIEAFWDDKIGFIVPSKGKTTKTVVSHMDLIKKFNKGFKEKNTFTIEDGKLIGALDNTFTNAVVINHILNNQDNNTNYVFTLDEETKQHAIRDYMKKYGINQFVINLDTTNDGWNSNYSIEYDEPCYQICKQIKENLDSPYFTKDRVCDDLDGVMSANGFGLSYCIPTKETIHSYKNYTMLDKIEPYMEGLEYLVCEMSLKEYEPNIGYSSINTCLLFKNFSLFKKDKENKHTQDSYDDSFDDGYKKYAGEGFSRYLEMSKYTSENTIFSDSVLKTIKISGITDINKFSKFILDQKKYNTHFSFQTFFAFFPYADIYVLLEKKLFKKNDFGYSLNKKVLFSKKVKKELTLFTDRFSKAIVKSGVSDIDKFTEFMISQKDSGTTFSLKTFIDKFPEAYIDEFTKNYFFIDLSAGYLLDDSKIFNKEYTQKEELLPIMIDLIERYALTDKKGVKKFKNFILSLDFKESFHVDEFEKIFDGDSTILYTLYSYNLFKGVSDFEFRINHKFINSSMFKLWKFSLKDSFDTIDSFELFNLMYMSKKILYKDLLKLEDSKDDLMINKFITKAMSERLLTPKKDGFRLT